MLLSYLTMCGTMHRRCRRVDARHGFRSAYEGELAEQAGDARLQKVQALFCAGGCC